MSGKFRFTYGLKFFFPEESTEGLPAIGFVFSSNLLSDVNRKLATMMESKAGIEGAESYLGCDSSFTGHEDGLFGSEPFGFGRCATLTRYGETAVIKIFLVGNNFCRHACLMINLVVATLHSFLSVLRKDGEVQEIIRLRTLVPVKNDDQVHSHSVGGALHRIVIDWLIKQSKDDAVRETSVNYIERAMQCTFSQVTDFTSDFSDHNRASIPQSSRFILRTFGDETDLSIYPEAVDYQGMGSQEAVDFGSHNLDSDYQQLTLLAGLAMMCRLAMEEVGV